MDIQLINIKDQYLSLKNEIDAAVEEVMNSGAYINGFAVKNFEEDAAKYLQVKHAIGCNSGTDALQLLLMAWGIGKGDEVITTPFTFVATSEVISLLGAEPVFADIDENTFNLDVKKIEERITDRTKAIIPVHLYGQSVDMDPLMEIAKKHDIKILEDACQSFGTKYNGKRVSGIGDGAAISFYPTKNLGTHGDGGLVTTNDDETAEKVRLFASHGQPSRYYQDVIGINSRLDAIQAAILNVKLNYIDGWNEARAKNAAYYSEKISGNEIVVPETAEYSTHIFHQYTLRVPNRDDLSEHLQKHKVPHGVYYPVPLHLQKAYAGYGFYEGEFPVCEMMTKEVISLPMHSDLTEEQMNYITEKISDFY